MVTYLPAPDLLMKCVASVAESTYRPIELVVVDNSSNDSEGSAALHSVLQTALAGRVPVRVDETSSNLGYAVATNRGVALSEGDLILLLNPDAHLDQLAISALVGAANRRPEALGFAPKILLTDPEVALDSVGMALLPSCIGVQRGLGQADIGQYDLEEQVSGLCFATALIRREAWAPERVGPLSERFFMFYEDVDWSLRAQVYGEEFWSVPASKVWHFHSATTRHLGGAFKTRLIQRNLIWTAVHNLELKAAGRVLLRRSAANLRNALRLRHPMASLQAVVEAWAGLPAAFGTRSNVQARRRRSDAAILGHVGELTFFDADNYAPETSVAALIAVLERLYAVAPEPNVQSAYLRVRSAWATGLGRDRARVAAMVRESGITVSPALDWLLTSLEDPLA